MKKKQYIKRKYNFSDADLYAYTAERIQLAKEDLRALKAYGYDPQRLKKLAGLLARFLDLPNDDELVGRQMLLTEKKDQSATRLRNAIRSIMTRVAMKYNRKSGHYRQFGTAKLGDMSDPQLLFCGRRVVRVARRQLQALADTGLNEDQLQKVVKAYQDFEKVLNLQQDRIAERDIAVERRIELGNKIYDELIVLCELGKDLWAEKDRRRYDRYVLYKENSSPKSAVSTPTPS